MHLHLDLHVNKYQTENTRDAGEYRVFTLKNRYRLQPLAITCDRDIM